MTGREPDLRVLQPGDETALDAFLVDHTDTSMFLRANARAAGLTDRGAPLEATYVAALEGGRITGVAAHCWNGMVLVPAPAHTGALACQAVRRSGRAVTRPVRAVGPGRHRARGARPRVGADRQRQPRRAVRARYRAPRRPPAGPRGRAARPPSRDGGARATH